jgi:SAM-dependent methyltransferase
METKNNRNNSMGKGIRDTLPKSGDPSSKNSLPDWNRLYSDMDVEDMPWYLPDLDPDLKEALSKYQVSSGSFLDIGTGPGTQAIALSKMGFEVTGVDISAKAIEKAQKLNEDVIFLQDDILNTRINQKFNSIFDRGCFHIIEENKRPVYISEILKLLTPEGMFFLKCFSDKNPDSGYGPYRFSGLLIERLFSERFAILDIKDSVYQSMSVQHNQTLFVVMKKIKDK